MKSDQRSNKASKFIARLAAEGLYSFPADQARAALLASPAAVKLALYRLAKQGFVASPARGFYVIVPPEYRRLGCLPADQFIPALMAHLGLTYYAGLLSAAQYHGAAHHRPQVFQVMLARNRRPIQCGAVRATFVARKRIADVPVQTFNNPRGTIRVATVEATAVDLVGYPGHAGGLDQVATVLAELAPQIAPEKLLIAARTAPISWIQRLGYLLERVGAGDQAAPLKPLVRVAARNTLLLAPGAGKRRAARSRDWRLWINADVDPEA